MKYPKINTIWKRDVNNKNRIIEGEFSRPEFANIKNWHVTEKIDGTNIRASYYSIMPGLAIGEVSPALVRFDGKTDDAQISSDLYAELTRLFPLSKFQSVFPDTLEKPSPTKVVLYGEGYGPKIHKGGGTYRDDPGFILFDVWIDGWWLQRENVEDIARKFNIPCVPSLGVMEYQSAIDLVKTSPQSVAANKVRVIEGIVARSHPLVLFRDGTPVMWKIKIKDFMDLGK